MCVCVCVCERERERERERREKGDSNYCISLTDILCRHTHSVSPLSASGSTVSVVVLVVLLGGSGGGNRVDARASINS